MKFFISCVIILLLLAILISKNFPLATPIGRSVYNTNMKIVSSAFTNNNYMPSNYSCDGEKINPPLHFLDVPKTAKNLVLIVDDPDAPMGTFVHWVVYNIPPKVTEIKENSSIAGGVNGINSMNKTGYVAACPPSGTHRYFFKLYALDTILQINGNADKQQVEQAMQNHIITQTELIGLYKRK